MNRFLFFFYLVILLVLSLLPVQHLPGGVFDFWDKAQHVLGYAVLGLLARRAYPEQGMGRLALWLLAFGAGIELLQAWSGWRYGEWADLLANGIGIALGLLLWSVLPRSLKA